MPSNERGQFATVLQQYRARAGLSQEELAERAGLSPRGVSDLERGLRRAPHPGTARRLADALALTEPDRAHLLAVASAPHGEPMTSGSGANRDNLPVQFTRFIGRAWEIVDLCRELQQTRLLTLCGPGGVGKTRLALEVGWAQLRAFDGVMFVARTLSIREIPGESCELERGPGTDTAPLMQSVVRTPAPSKERCPVRAGAMFCPDCEGVEPASSTTTAPACTN